jgi:hypothetical protein
MSCKPVLTAGPAVVPIAYFPCTSRHECIHAMVLEMHRLHANHSGSDDGNSRFYRHHSRRAECCNAGNVVMAGVESGRCRRNKVYGRCICNLRIVGETAHPGIVARGYGHSARLSLYSTCSLQLICRTIVTCAPLGGIAAASNIGPHYATGRIELQFGEGRARMLGTLRRINDVLVAVRGVGTQLFNVTWNTPHL